jgi:O-Antigen ligase
VPRCDLVEVEQVQTAAGMGKPVAIVPQTQRATRKAPRLCYNCGGLRTASIPLLPIALPGALLIAGALVGYLFTLDEPVARERLLGVVIGTGLALAAAFGLQQLERPEWVLIGAAALGGLGMVWIIAADEPSIFRGPLGAPLGSLFRPLYGTVQLTDPVAVTNTRFIVGYNGLADLCLLVIFACGALLVDQPTRRLGLAMPLAGAVAVSLLVLVGAGSRGGLDGLVVGVCAVVLVAWAFRRALVAVVAVPAVAGLVALGLIDKGLEITSTTGRFVYWSDLARLLVEYPLTGVGLGIDTANRVAVQYEINPDPERLFYAHNTFVETYLEQGPLGLLGSLLIPVAAVLIAVLARRCGVVKTRRPLLLAGLGLLAGLEAHGLTDQVVTTNLGSLLTLLSLAAMLSGLTEGGQRLLTGWMARVSLACGGVLLLGLVGLLVLPAGRAQVLLDLGGLQMNRAFALDPQSVARPPALAQAETLFSMALQEQDGHPGALRDLAQVRWGRYDDSGALDALKRAAESSRLDAFDVLQIAHRYRDMGFSDDAYAWATRAYATWGRPAPDAILRAYAQQTLPDDFRIRVLADQAEGFMHARDFQAAVSLFSQALSFAPNSRYLQDRLAEAERAANRQSGG